MRVPISDGPISKRLFSLDSRFEDMGTSTLVKAGRKDVRNVSFSVWEQDYEGYVGHVIREIHSGDLYWPKPKSRKELTLATEVELLPRPDNTYDSRAISVSDALCPEGPVHMGYLYTRDVNSLSHAVRGFCHLTNKPLRCLMLTNFYKSKKAEFPFDQNPELRKLFKSVGFVPSGSSLVLPRRRALIDAMGSHLRESYGPILAPADELRVGVQKKDLDRLRHAHGDELFELEFIADGDVIKMVNDSIELNSLVAKNERFFERTYNQVLEIGVPVRVLAQCRTKNIVVFVENRVPLEDSPGWAVRVSQH